MVTDCGLCQRHGCGTIVRMAVLLTFVMSNLLSERVSRFRCHFLKFTIHNSLFIIQKFICDAEGIPACPVGQVSPAAAGSK